MNSQQETKVGEDKTLGSLQAILYLLQEQLSKFQEEVERSDALLKIGEKTALSKQIESHLKNPMKTIFAMSSNVDQQVKQIVDRLVKKFLQTKIDVVDSAFQTKTAMDDLHYSIVLKEDTTENREKIFSFLDGYDILDISHRYPVYFQFVPHELIGEISVKEAVKLA